MFRTYGRHQEQIRRLSESIQAFYCIRRTPIASNVVDINETSSISGTKTGTFAENVTRATIPATPQSKAGLIGIKPDTSKVGTRLFAKCHCCGEKFSQLDFAYTMESGLCIPCWEIGVV